VSPAIRDRTVAALTPVTDLVPHLRWRVGPLADDELACHELVVEPDRLWASVAATAEGRGSSDPQVLASLWFQAYAYRVAGVSLASFLLSGVLPDARAEVMGIGIARSRPSSVVWLPGAADPTTALDQACARLFAGHLDPIVEGLRSQAAVGEQLLWGNCAAACASATGAVISAAGTDADPLWHRAGRFLVAAAHGLDGLGDWTPTDDGPAYRRRTCCLWFKTTPSEGHTCEDCSLRSPATLAFRHAGGQAAPASEQSRSRPAGR
jgi:ferric iron reductase protein FhuF